MLAKTPENSFNVETVRKDFPILSKKIRGKNLVYFDNAASTQRPQAVVDAITKVYEEEYANVHRGVHQLSANLSARFEAVREQIATFVGTKDLGEIIYTRGTTESANLVAQSWLRSNVTKGDLVLVSAAEHHSNFVPWQDVARATGATFEILELTDDGFIDRAKFSAAMERKPKFLGLTAMSNVLGNINPIRELVTEAKAAGATVFIDGAQLMAHQPQKISAMGPVDFLAFSAHKMCGPTGIGVLWGRRELLDAMAPYHFGGGMVEEVGDQETSWGKLPWKFEAGTPNIVGVIAFGEALEYLETIGFDQIVAHEQKLLKHAIPRLLKVPGLKLFGSQNTDDRGAVLSFMLDGVHPHDVGSFLDTEGIAVRVGHHCAQPLMRRLGVEGTVRASLYFYNTEKEVDILIDALHRARKLFLE